MYVFLHVRQGSSLILKSINGKITKEEIPTPIIGRRVLHSVGCDTREVLKTARDKYADDIDVVDHLVKDGNEEESEGKLAELFDESVFHNG